MRLKARAEIAYAGKTWQPGTIFDALDPDGRDFINKDLAVPFNLEDPSDRSLRDALENLLPDVPPVSISPTSASPGAAGGEASFDVTMNGPGLSGTWTVSKDASADWLTIVSPTTPQSVDGPVNYTVAPNPDVERGANMYVNGKTFTVTQSNIGSRKR